MATQAIPNESMEVMGAVQVHATSIAERNRALFELQRRARRGPTPEVFFTKHIDNSRIVKAENQEQRREMRRFALVMGALFLLVMFYVLQHFSSIEYGYRVELQKQQLEDMREQNRQLRLSEAMLSDPGRIDRMARELGLNAPAPGQVVRPDGIVDASAPALAEAAPAAATPAAQ
jgi:cell division protein FtsL